MPYVIVYFQDGISAGEQNDGAAFLERQVFQRVIKREFNWDRAVFMTVLLWHGEPPFHI